MRKKWWMSPYHNLTFLKVAWYKTWKWICWGHCLAGRCRKEADNWWRPSPYHNFTFLNSAWYKTCRWIGWGHRLAGRCRKEADNWWRSENENCEHNSDRQLAKNMRASNLDKKSSSWQKVVQFPPEMRTKNLAIDQNIDSPLQKKGYLLILYKDEEWEKMINVPIS